MLLRARTAFNATVEHTAGGYVLGIDCGTTHTAAAVLRSGRAEVLRLGARRAEVPSLVFVPADGPVLIGEPAERRGQGDPGRLAREFKRRVGDPVPMLVGGAPYSAHALIARVLEHVLRTAVAHQGGPPEHVVLTCPANWGPYKRELLEQAARLADLPPVTLRTEPEAAAIEYASGERVGDGDIIAVYDLGGGTFDAAVLRRTPAGFAILGSPEGIEQLGGIDFDEAVFEHVMRTLPAERLATPDVAALARLRRDCVEAKEALSDDTEVMIPVALPELHTRVRLTRAEFEEMIRPALSETTGALRRALRSAGVRPEEVRTILLSGGSSRIPLVGQLLSTEFGRPVVLDPYPEHSIAMGAARAGLGPPSAPPSPPTPAPVTAGPPPPATAAVTPETAPLAVPATTPAQPADVTARMPPPAAGRVHGSTPVPPPDDTGRWPGRRAQMLLAAVAVLVIAGVTAFFLQRRDRDDPVTAGAPAAPAPAVASAAPSSAAPACVPFNERFDGDTVAAVWERTRPDVDLTVARSRVQLTVPDGADLHEDRADAAMLLREVSGDFVLETTLTAEPAQFYQGAGLVLLAGDGRYVRLELGYGDIRALVYEYRDGGAHTRVHPPFADDRDVVRATTNDLELQLERSGDRITARWRPAPRDGEFRDLGTITAALPGTVRAGVAVLNRAQSGAEPEPFPATFFRVVVTC